MRRKMPPSWFRLLPQEKKATSLSIIPVGDLLVSLHGRTWEQEKGFSDWQFVRKLSIIEASTFLGHAGARETKQVGIYVDLHNHEYKLTGVFH